MSNKIIKVYGDCGSYNNGRKDPNKPQFGATGTIVVDGDDNILFQDTLLFKDKTNNFCELLSMLKGLVFAVNNYPDAKIEVYSDSQYTIYGARDRLAGWVKNGWKTKSKTPVVNRELWEVVYEINNGNFNIEYKWIKGHQGKTITKEENYDVYYQEMCDSIATKLIEKKLKCLNLN